MDKLPLKYRFLQFVADNYILVLFLTYLVGVGTGIIIEMNMLLSSNG